MYGEKGEKRQKGYGSEHDTQYSDEGIVSETLTSKDSEGLNLYSGKEGQKNWFGMMGVRVSFQEECQRGAYQPTCGPGGAKENARANRPVKICCREHLT